VFGVSASDPLTLVVVAVMLAVVALIASLVPAYRASRLDPLTVLRDN
jgi:putative ABC transport system permease protein